MRYAADFKDYQLLDSSSGEKLERFGNITLIRPDPQIIWKSERNSALWKTADAKYFRSREGGGNWEFYKKLPTEWKIKYDEITFIIRPTGFKHTGIFPEQAVNWRYMMDKVKKAGRPVSALNLFAYTGGATLALASAGAKVTHVDASKGIVSWARENAAASNLSDKPIRWIVDDCKKFIEREIRRGNKYDCIVLDPPSYGRGPTGEVFKLEDQIYDLLVLLSNLLSDEPLFLLLNSYTTGLGPAVMAYLLNETVAKGRKASVSAEEIGIPVKDTGKILPCGNTAICEF
jgi:23S rRNA (cytosine1962-C5)-methyltransferase